MIKTNKNSNQRFYCTSASLATRKIFVKLITRTSETKIVPRKIRSAAALKHGSAFFFFFSTFEFCDRGAAVFFSETFVSRTTLPSAPPKVSLQLFEFSTNKNIRIVFKRFRIIIRKQYESDMNKFSSERDRDGSENVTESFKFVFSITSNFSNFELLVNRVFKLKKKNVILPCKLFC